MGIGTPFLVESLDRRLAERGQDVILRRVTGTGPGASKFDAPCRALVRGYRPTELTANIAQGDTLVTLSPSDLERAQWPDGQPISSPPPPVDRRVTLRGDLVVIGGIARAVMVPDPLYVAGELVRIDLQVRG